MRAERTADPHRRTAADVDHDERERYRSFVSMLTALPSDSKDNPTGLPADRALELTTRPDPPRGYVFERVSYGSAGQHRRELRLLLYRPRDPTVARPGVIFEIYPGLGHNFAWVKWSETVDRMTAFLEEHLGRGPGGGPADPR